MQIAGAREDCNSATLTAGLRNLGGVAAIAPDGTIGRATKDGYNLSRSRPPTQAGVPSYALSLPQSHRSALLGGQRAGANPLRGLFDLRPVIGVLVARVSLADAASRDVIDHHRR